LTIFLTQDATSPPASPLFQSVPIDAPDPASVDFSNLSIKKAAKAKANTHITTAAQVQREDMHTYMSMHTT
jgi:hypothetical protein